MQPTSGAPVTLLLLPGMDGDGRLFDRLRAVLDAHRRYQVQVLSYNELGILTYDEAVEAVRARVLGLGPVVLVGESFSGPVVARLCSSPTPNLVAGVLIASFPCSPVPFLKGLVLALSTLVFSIPPPRWAVRLALLGNRADGALLGEVQATISSVSSKVLVSRLRAILEVDVQADLRQSCLPMLSLHASNDRLVPVRVSRQMAQGCARMVEVELVGPHLLAQANPAGVAREISGFLERLEKTAPFSGAPNGT